MASTRLFLMVTRGTGAAAEACAAADGLVATPDFDGVGAMPHEGAAAVLLNCPPGSGHAWCEHATVLWAGDGGLDALAALRDRWPELAWVPRAHACRAPQRFEFRNDHFEDGFKTYKPDLASYRGYRVNDREMDLRDWLERAWSLGFERAWLHNADAAQRGAGFDLELAERARSRFAGELWLSGGATRAVHLQNLAREGAVQVAVVEADMASRCGATALRAALRPPIAVAQGEGSCAGAASRA